MTKKEKILKGISCCLACNECNRCPYNCGHGCKGEIMKDCRDVITAERREVKENPNAEYIPNFDNHTGVADLRPCLMNGIKGFFHCWVNMQKIYNPALECGGIGGQISYIVGLVELQDGQCMLVEPLNIVFTDRSAKND